MSAGRTRNEDTARADGELIRAGVVESVDLSAARCTVAIGDLVTGPLPWFAPRAGATRKWSPPSVGEQVVLLCAEGDIESGFVLLGVYSDDTPPPSTEDIDLVEYEDGTIISYDPVAHELKAVLAAGGKARLEAPGGVTIIGDVAITGEVTITGDVGVEGTVTATEDVVGGGKSLKTHKHLQVQPGAGVSGVPQ